MGEPFFFKGPLKKKKRPVKPNQQEYNFSLYNTQWDIDLR